MILEYPRITRYGLMQVISAVHSVVHMFRIISALRQLESKGLQMLGPPESDSNAAVG